MGMISQMEVVSDVGLWALLAPAFPHGSRPLAVFIGDSVRSLAACIPLPLPTQWWVSAAFLCLCALSETQPGLGKPQHSAKRLALCLADFDGHILSVLPRTPAIDRCYLEFKRVSSLNPEWTACHISHHVIKGSRDFEINSGDDVGSRLSCLIISFWLLFPCNRSFSPSVFLKKCKRVCSKPFSLLFILLQLFGFLSCSDATAVQTPFPPADSVASLRRCGLGVLVAGRRRGRERGKGREGKGGDGGGGRWVRGSHIRPASLSHAREKSWLIVSTMAPCTLSHSTTNRSPRQTLLLYCSAVAWKSTCDVRKCAKTYDAEQRNARFEKPHLLKTQQFMQCQIYMRVHTYTHASCTILFSTACENTHLHLGPVQAKILYNRQTFSWCQSCAVLCRGWDF